MGVSILPSLGKIYYNKYRPYCPILTITKSENIAKLNCIIRGTYSIIYDDVKNNDKVIAFTKEFLLSNRIISKNSTILYLTGLQDKNNLTIEQMRVLYLGDYSKNQLSMI